MLEVGADDVCITDTDPAGTVLMLKVEVDVVWTPDDDSDGTVLVVLEPVDDERVGVGSETTVEF